MRRRLSAAEGRRSHTPILRVWRPTGAAAETRARTARPGAESAFAAEAATEGRGGTSYHAIREHDPVRVACVRCHTTHTTDSDAGHRFISRDSVVRVCRECHTEM